MVKLHVRITLVISGNIMSCLTSDTTDPEYSMISIGTPPSRPVMTAALVHTAATIIKLTLSLVLIVWAYCWGYL